MQDSVFILVKSKKRFFKKIGLFFYTCFSYLPLPRSQKDICCSSDSYTIVTPVSMVQVGGHYHSKKVHILVYGRISPPQPDVTVQVAFQAHQLDLDSVASGETRPVTVLTDQAGEFIVDEKFICGSHVKFLTSVTSLPGSDTPTAIASLRLKRTDSHKKKSTLRNNKKPLPTAAITIDFESHCQSSVTYWFENPYKKGTISKTTEILYCPTESSALYLKLFPHKEKHTSIIDIFTTTEEHPVPRYQRVHTTKKDEEFIRIAIFDSESTIKSALILV
jgi:hypothetical protein